MSHRSGGGGARRGHLSHKVPNVKLRPAPSKSQFEASSAGAHDAADIGDGGTSRERRKRRKRMEDDEENALSAMDKERIRAMNERDGVIDDDSSYDPELAHAQTSLPFAPISLCFTSLDPGVKESQAHMARQMGCVRVDRALMGDTKALVASEPKGPKYEGAIAHRIPVFSIDWISACHERWLRGEEIRDPLEMQDVKLKCFVGCKVALTGIEPISKRKRFQQAIETNGGTYSGGLDRSCTHLIVASDTPPTASRSSGYSPKIQFALKTNADSRDRRKYLESLLESARRGETQMNEEQASSASRDLAELPHVALVWEGWLWDCVELGARFPTDTWDVERAASHPREEETEVWKERRRQEEEAKKLVQDIVDQDAAATADVKDASTAAAIKSERRSALAESSTILKVGPDQLEQARIRRRVPSSAARGSSAVGTAGGGDGAVSALASADQMLADMVAAVEQSAVKVEADSAPVEDMAIDEDVGEPSSSGARKRRRLALAKPSASEPVRREAAGASSLVHRSRSDAFERPTEAAKERSAVAVTGPSGGATINGSGTSSAQATQYDPELFKGLTFGVHIPGCVTDKLVEAIKLNGGKYIEAEAQQDGDRVDYMIVKLGSSDIPGDILPPTRLATECWVERCIHTKQIASLESHVAHEPLGHAMPIEGAEHLSIHLSGLPLEDVHLSRKLIKAIGAVVTPEMSRKRTTHLISAHESGIKLEKAQQWKIPVVSIEWLHATARAGAIQPVEAYQKALVRVGGEAPAASPASKRARLAASNTIQGSKLVESASMFDLKEGASKADDAPVEEQAPSQHSSSQSRKLGLAPTDVNTLDQKSAARKSASHSQQQETTAEAQEEQKSAPDVVPNPAFEDTRTTIDEPSEAPRSKRTKSRSEDSPAVDIPNIIEQLAQQSERAEAVDGPGSGRPIRRIRGSARQRSTSIPFAVPLEPSNEGQSASVPDGAAEESLTMPESEKDTFDQSYRVMYQDPTAERERKRLLDTFNETQGRSRRRR